jgi:glutaredoxin
MKRTVLLTLACAIFAAPLVAAQLYRWVDEKGHVEWRDTPPPSTARKVEQRNIGANTIQTSELPYSVQQAVKDFPVTLWLTNCGDTCDKARAHLNRRGVPHTEKDAQSEIEAFKKASGGGMEVPLLFVGSNRLKGYLESDWDAALDAAGYPKTALAPIKPQPKAPPPKNAQSETPPVKLYTNAQCGTQCAEAKELLSSRGVKFQEIAVETPSAVEEVKKLSGNTVLPVLVVGRFAVPGFDSASYQRALDESGFQRSQ